MLPDVGRHALARIIELIDELVDSGLVARLPDELGPIAETTSLWTALLSCEAFRAGLVGAAELEAAGRLLAGLGRSPLSVVRAIAWPWRSALEFERTAAGALVTGLLIEDGGDALALTIASLRRSVRLGGVRLAEVRPGIRTVAELRSASLGALWHLTPMLTWDDLPAYVACAEGVAGGRRDADPARGRPVAHQRVGHLAGRARPDRYGRGVRDRPAVRRRYHQITGVLDTQAPGEVRRKGELLVFGAQGITVEVTAPAATEDGNTVEVAVTGRSLGGATVRVARGGAHLLLKASPRIAFSDVAFVVREDAARAPPPARPRSRTRRRASRSQQRRCTATPRCCTSATV